MLSITIDHLTKRFGATTALDDISLRIEAGELFFLLGPSGCGKTTLLRNIAGFYIPDGGRIFFGDQDVTRVPPHKRNTGMMFQSYALWPHMTVARNVAFGLEERRVPKAEIERRVIEALASVRMEKYAARKINQLSGGQQQRVALARAMVIRPRCVLLDEPLSNLDARLRLEMRLEIRRICKEFNLTAIYVTHDQKEALSVSDRMAILDAGKLAQVGTAEDIYRRPASKLVADFIGETNFLPGSIRTIENDIVQVETPYGLFSGKTTNRASVGDEVTLSIRPESWKLQTQKPGSTSANFFSGRITETTYLGELAQYEFSAAGQKLKIYELNPKFLSTRNDTDLFATVDVEDVVVLTK
ncbi:MAG TPA: ABC transporter ATP-binding protein [Chthoniobacterales bacterium]